MQREHFRKAFRCYTSSQRRWERILDLGPRAAETAGLDTEEAVDDVRRRRQRD